MLFRVEADGRVYRLIQRQVGWRGQSGAFYPLDQPPYGIERGSFSPMYVTVEADRIETPDPEELING
jgi:hypothetical protein